MEGASWAVASVAWAPSQLARWAQMCLVSGLPPSVCPSSAINLHQPTIHLTSLAPPALPCAAAAAATVRCRRSG